jgi:hypothetical protein
MRELTSRPWALVLAALLGWAGALAPVPWTAGDRPVSAAELSLGHGSDDLPVPPSPVLAVPTIGAEAPVPGDGSHPHPLPPPATAGRAVLPTPPHPTGASPRAATGLLGLTAHPATAPPLS